MDEAEIVLKVTEVVQVALKRNQRTETAITAILAIMALSGIALFVYSTIERNWQATLQGSICELAIVMPVRYLLRLRQENVRLETLPSLLMLADTAAKKKLVFDFLSKFIGQMPS